MAELRVDRTGLRTQLSVTFKPVLLKSTAKIVFVSSRK